MTRDQFIAAVEKVVLEKEQGGGRVTRARLIHEAAKIHEAATSFNCKARASKTDPPQDCDWPHCGCDPAADRVLGAFQESGHELAREGTRWALENCAALARREAIRKDQTRRESWEHIIRLAKEAGVEGSILRLEPDHADGATESLRLADELAKRACEILNREGSLPTLRTRGDLIDALVMALDAYERSRGRKG